MSRNILTMGTEHANEYEYAADPAHKSQELLVENLETLLEAARPRLLRLARTQGVAGDAAEDVVQETLVEAWRHLNTLRAPDRFDAWLNGICCNICLRWTRARGATESRQINLSSLYLLAEQRSSAEDFVSWEIADPLALDPVEELQRQDLEILLDRALGYLPQNTRALLELRYLAELSESEVALRLGLTISALEARLHRARRQLQQVLSKQMQAEAEAFGLAIDRELSEGWRETREWCWGCGRHRLRGMFESLSNGRVSLRMRCPECGDIVGSGGYPAMEGLHSFRPALKRLWQSIHDVSQGLESGWQACTICGTRQRIRVITSDEFNATYPFLNDPAPQKFIVTMECPSCASLLCTDAAGCVWLHPAIQGFIAQHPRFVLEPELPVNYVGTAAIRLRIVAVTSAAQLTLLTDAQTMHVLATFRQ